VKFGQGRLTPCADQFFHHLIIPLLYRCID
jgi:hypothetical protein